MAGRHGLDAWQGTLVALCYLTAGVLALQSPFHRVADMDGILPSADSLFHRAHVSEMTCAFLCSKTQDCQTFTFVGDGEGSCYGYGYSSSVGSQTTSGAAVNGAKTYTLTDVTVTTTEGCQQQPDNSETFVRLVNGSFAYLGRAVCEGHWLVFQRRQNGREDFYRRWDHYRNGFGFVEDEYWLGLEVVRQLTSQGIWNLRVDLTDKDGISVYALYTNFRLGSEDSFYPLLYDSYEGTAGNSLSGHRGRPFTTKDMDNDLRSSNCAVVSHGAWWYESCHMSNLNGDYGNDNYGLGLTWLRWRGHEYSLPFTQMKIEKV